MKDAPAELGAADNLAADAAQAAVTARMTNTSAALYSATIFLSAALLFCLEPMFSKMVLPVLGGTAAVWSIAMVVFQGLLLAGYLYAHALTRWFSGRAGAAIHMIVLLLGTLPLPIAISGVFAAPPPEDGISLWLIGLFLASIGLPCFALSATAPLLQAWFARSGHRDAENPYFLYRASNLGSFAVLLAYPFAIEPLIGLSLQSRLWSWFYLALIAGMAACAVAVARAPAAERKVRAVARASSQIGVRERLLWTVLSFIPAALLVAVTAHIATDVASGPFLWIGPLAIYLFTFVLVFTETPLLPPKWLLAAQPAATAVLVLLFLWTNQVGWALALAGHLAAFFVTAMVCHRRLYEMRPSLGGLTEFYVFLSLGGVLGGCFAALLAPLIFPTVLEYPLLVFAALLVRPGVWQASRRDWMRDGVFVAILAAVLAGAFVLVPSREALYIVSVMALAVLVAVMGFRPGILIPASFFVLAATNFYDPSRSIVFEGRSFYGAYKAADIDGTYRLLFHGITVHGAERIADIAPGKRIEPLTYYYPDGPFHQAVEAVRTREGRLNSVALVGLGIGTLTCDARAGERWTIYEIDPLIVSIARDTRLFQSMSRCATGDAVVLGDGRLTLKSAKPGIDLLILDIFSSDAVPTHLLTQEAFALYKAKLSRHGYIVFNISNKNMELGSVVAASAAANGMTAVTKRERRELFSRRTMRFPAEIAIVGRSPADIAALKLDKGWRAAEPDARIWTDDYADVLGAILRRMSEHRS